MRISFFVHGSNTNLIPGSLESVSVNLVKLLSEPASVSMSLNSTTHYSCVVLRGGSQSLRGSLLDLHFLNYPLKESMSVIILSTILFAL